MCYTLNVVLFIYCASAALLKWQANIAMRLVHFTVRKQPYLSMIFPPILLNPNAATHYFSDGLVMIIHSSMAS